MFTSLSQIHMTTYAPLVMSSSILAQPLLRSVWAVVLAAREPGGLHVLGGDVRYGVAVVRVEVVLRLVTAGLFEPAESRRDDVGGRLAQHGTAAGQDESVAVGRRDDGLAQVLIV